MPTASAMQWFKGQFGVEIEAAVIGTPYSLDMLVAVASQETGYIWNRLRQRTPAMPVARILELCVGDTIDARGAFPKSKAQLIAKPNGQQMFDIARAALVDMAQFIADYQPSAAKPDKFCHGFGVFQYDIQHFLNDPDYFLERRYIHFSDALAKCVGELKEAQVRNGWAHKTSLTELEMVGVCIAYNAGRYVPSKGLQQGFFDGTKFYGELIFDYIRLAKTVTAATTGTTTPGTVVIPPPTPVTALGPVYEVDTLESPLRMRREPRVDPANVIANLPDGHLVRAVTDTPVNTFLEIETSLDGALLRGFSALKFLKPRPDAPAIAVESPAPAAPQIGVVAVLMPRKQGTVTRRVDIAGAHSLNEAGQPNRQGTTAEELRKELAAIVGWLAPDKKAHKRYQPREGLTFCNIYAHDFCHLAGVYLPRVWWTSSAIAMLSVGGSVEPKLGSTITEQRANDLFRWLREFGLSFGWRQTGSLTKLQMEANQGAVGLIVAQRKQDGRPGHITIVVPETADVAAKRTADGEVVAPVQSQAGATNFSFGTGKAGWWMDSQFSESAFWLHA